MADARCVVLGIGNAERGDDGVGRAVARQLRGSLPDTVELSEATGEASDLLARIDGAAVAYLIDACVSGAFPGTVRRFDLAAGPLPEAAFGLSTHGLGLSAALELARALGQLPRRCVVYAVEGLAFELGATLSEPVAKAVDTVADQLKAEIRTYHANGEQACA